MKIETSPQTIFAVTHIIKGSITFDDWLEAYSSVTLVSCRKKILHEFILSLLRRSTSTYAIWHYPPQ